MRKLTKTRITTILLATLALLLCVGQVFCQDEENADNEEVLAKVNGRTFTKGEVMEEIQENPSRYQRSRMPGAPADQSDRAVEMAVKTMVDEVILKDAAKEMNVEVTEEDVETEIQKLKDRFPDEATFKQILQRQNVTMEKLKSDMSEQLLIKNVIDNVTANSAKVSDEEAREFYEENKRRFMQQPQVKASHILIKVEKEASEEEKAEAKKKIEGYLKKIKEGADFSELAEENSDCPSGKRAGGDLGWFGQGRMVPAFEEVAFELEPGEISDVVETQFGYHIIKVTDKKAGGQQEFAEVKDDLKSQLVNKKKGETFVEWLEKKREAKAEFFIGEDKEEKAETSEKEEKSE